MLPSKGFCLAVFLLVRAAHFRSFPSTKAWVEGARGQSTIMAAALDLDGAALAMIRMGFVDQDPATRVRGPVAGLWEMADRRTLVDIARLVLARNIPEWLDLAAGHGAVSQEYIPTTDLAQLSWLDGDLESLLIEIWNERYKKQEDAFLAAMGLAGELAV
jgi:hypothetical protein